MSWLKNVLRTKVLRLGAGSMSLYLAPFQTRVAAWVFETFGDDLRHNKPTRDHRFMEEAIELYQALGHPIDRLWQVACDVYAKEPGDPKQELGGVQTTLAALSEGHGLDMVEARETELARMWTKVEAIRAKAASKSKYVTPQGPQFKENNWEPTAAQIDSACYSFTHDFGLLDADKQAAIRFAAREWLRAWMRELPSTPALRKPNDTAPTPLLVQSVG
jgi:hypothetical protein